MNDGSLPGRQPKTPTPDVRGLVAASPTLGLSDADGFELNTDSSLFDPHWDDFERAHEQRYGLAIEHLKSRVRGRSYDNDAMKVRVGIGGYYTQAQNFPAAFYGDTGKARVTHVSSNEAAAVVWEAVAHYRAEEAYSITCIYSDDEPPDFFLGYRVSDDRRYEIGTLRSALPLHMRVIFDADSAIPMLGARGGTLLYQRTRSGKHVLVRAPGRRQPLLSGSSLG